MAREVVADLVNLLEVLIVFAGNFATSYPCLAVVNSAVGSLKGCSYPWQARAFGLHEARNLPATMAFLREMVATVTKDLPHQAVNFL